MTLAKGAFHSAAHVRAVDEAAVHCWADDSAVDVLAQFCGADGLAVESVAGWAIAVAESEFQCLKRNEREIQLVSQLFIDAVSNIEKL